MAHYLFNHVEGYAPRELATEFLRVGLWGVGIDEPHRDALAPGDLVLIYLGAPERMLIGRAELSSAVHEWTPSEAPLYPGSSAAGLSLTQVREWTPHVPMKTVLSHIDRQRMPRPTSTTASFGSPPPNTTPPSPPRQKYSHTSRPSG